MSEIKFKMVYDDKSGHLVDYIVDNYDIDIECWDINHHKEKKIAISIKVAAGTRLDPFLGAYDENDEIIGAMWRESIEFTEENIDLFIKHIKEICK